MSVDDLKKEIEQLEAATQSKIVPAPDAPAEDTKAQERVLIDRMLDETLTHEERLQAAEEALQRGFIPTGSAYFPITVTPPTALHYANRPLFKAYWHAVRDNPKLPHTDDVIRASLNRVLRKS